MDSIEKKECFNLYYLNLNKVYEISMMINNVIVNGIEKEKTDSSSKKNYINGSLSGGIDVDLKYLASIKSAIDTGISNEKATSSKVVEKLDIKTTKSILLNKIKNKCINVTDINSCKEGDLISIDDVQLSILDKDELMQMLILKRDALKGIQVDGIDINNLISSMIKDYSYVLSGKVGNSDIIIKIPFELENEFENNYNVDDILLGKVTVIGIYKNKNKLEDIASNTLNYFSSNSKTKNNVKKFINSYEEITKENRTFYKEEYHYIDVIAIVQNISFKEDKNENNKKNIFNIIQDFFRRKNEK
jgi:hypothetical protein